MVVGCGAQADMVPGFSQPGGHGVGEGIFKGVWVRSGVGDGTHATRRCSRHLGRVRLVALHDITPRHGEKWGVVSVCHYQDWGLQDFPVECSPFPNGHIDCWADNCGCISMGGYICTHTRGKYAHTHMNVSLVSAHVDVNAVGHVHLY